MSRLYITVGTSAFENAEIGTALDKSNVDLRKRIDSFKKDPDELKDQRGDWRSLKDELVAAHEEFWKRKPSWIEYTYHYRQTSAELLSTYLLLKLLDKQGNNDCDCLVLLSSATPEGRFAAEVNRQAMQSDAFFHRTGGIRREVEVIKVPGLTHESNNMIEILPYFLDIGAGGVVRVNMTGSYKGVAAALGFLAARPEAPRLHLFYLHEESDEPVILIPEHNYQGPPEAAGHPQAF